MTDIKSMTLEELRQALTGLGEKPFRAKQLYEWIHRKLAVSYDEMTNLSKHLREKLEINPAEPRYLKVVWGQGYKMEGSSHT